MMVGTVRDGPVGQRMAERKERDERKGMKGG